MVVTGLERWVFGGEGYEGIWVVVTLGVVSDDVEKRRVCESTRQVREALVL